VNLETPGKQIGGSSVIEPYHWLNDRFPIFTTDNDCRLSLWKLKDDVGCSGCSYAVIKFYVFHGLKDEFTLKSDHEQIGEPDR